MESGNPTDSPHPHQLLLRTLDGLMAATEANIARATLIRQRIVQMNRRLADGQKLVEVLASEPTPAIVELITENIEALQELGARMRWSQFSILRDDGMTAAEIARLFGVSRQRVSAILNNPPAAVEANPPGTEEG